MRREATRYKGVWDAGYSAAMRDAFRVLRDAIEAGVDFAIPGGFDTAQLAVRSEDKTRVWEVNHIAGLAVAADRARALR